MGGSNRPERTATGSRRLHREVSGVGTPIVVFESGLGMSGAVWTLVHPVIAQSTCAVVYDRAGIGSSPDAVGASDLDALARDLGSLLDELREEHADPEFVLVGHSWGGPIARVAAAARDDVRALVLVDPSDENLDAYFTPATRRRMRSAAPITRLAAALGVYRLAAGMGDGLPPAARERFRAENFGRRAAARLAAEIPHFLPGLAALRAAPPRVTAAMTIVSGSGGDLTRAHAASVARADAAGVHARLVVAEGAGHNVMLTRPDLVIRAVFDALAPADDPVADSPVDPV